MDQQPDQPERPGPTVSEAMIAAAARVAADVGADAIVVSGNSVPSLDALSSLLDKRRRLIVASSLPGQIEAAGRLTRHVLEIPSVQLSRQDQVKMAMLLAFSHRMIQPGQRFVFLTGVAGRPLDTLGVMQVGEESELFQTVDQPQLTEHIRRIVFRRVLTLALELASEGREGKPVGAIFVIGDDKEVQRLSQQNILNPVQGYPEKQRNILDDRMAQTIKEFSTIDGAFVIRGNGVVVSAGTTLRPNISGQPLPQGLGARHAAAAAITASTQSIAVTLSESDGTVRVWRRGQMITEIEKAKPLAAGRE